MIVIRDYIRPRKEALIKSIRSKTNPMLGKSRQKALDDIHFSIISNNCWGGLVYQYYNLPYQSPTAGLYFFADDYIRFVSRLEQYCACGLSFIDAKDSRHHAALKERGQEHVPIGLLDDVEIVFLHYPTREEALEKWTRRVGRINWEHLIVKFSQQNGAAESHLRAFDRLPFPVKFVFTTRDYGLASQVIYEESRGLPDIYDEVICFRKYLDLSSLINGKLVRTGHE
jgi:uncharacterized protein (DUF1919 family)